MVKMLLRKNRFWTRFSGEIGVPSGTGLVAVVLTRQHGHGDDKAKSDVADDQKARTSSAALHMTWRRFAFLSDTSVEFESLFFSVYRQNI